jgi:hypothetical protein
MTQALKNAQIANVAKEWDPFKNYIGAQDVRVHGIAIVNAKNLIIIWGTNMSVLKNSNSS